MIRNEDALRYHSEGRPGKIEVRSAKPCLTPRELRLAYLPGATFPSRAVAADPAAVFRYTAKGNLVAVVTDGTAVPGLGDVGPEAAKPIGEGMAVLFKRLADIDVFDLEVRVAGTDAFVELVRALEPTFGGVNLKDIRAPEGLVLFDRLTELLRIPVFHENLYSTAVPAAAALLNALDLVEKRIEDVRVVLCGAGTVGLGCARLFRRLGVGAENLALYDVHGLVHPAREDLFPHQRAFAREDAPSDLAGALRGADVFVGASAAGVLDVEMIRAMAPYPIVFALATPEPEIPYETARAARRDVIAATALGQDPNAVLDVLSFPYIFRGALDVHATRITEGMLAAAARALAGLAREDAVEEVVRAYGNQPLAFGPEYLLPKPIDPRILVRESAAVAEAAVADGVARRTVEPAAYEEQLSVRLGTGREMLRGLMLKARRERPRVVFTEGAHETILRASGILLDEGIARPVLLGGEAEIRESAHRLGLDLGGVAVVDPARSPRTETYAEAFFRMRARRGVILEAARERVRRRDVFGTMMLHAGDADVMVAGLGAHYAESMRAVLDVVGPAPGVARISGHYLVLRGHDAYVLADCAVNVDPSAEELAEIALLAARMARSVGLEPRVAMLSFSNFGSVDHPMTLKVRRAAVLAREREPELAVDGEMQLGTAVSSELRRTVFPFSRLTRDANVLVFPDLQAGNLALQMLQYLGDAVPIGPALMGTRLPVHLLQYGSSVEDVVNLTAVGVVEAASRKGVS